MSIKAGLVGLPNVGKSTLFNALTKSSVPAENYPFCTIDPHVAITHVPDERLNVLRDFFNSQKIIDASVTFVDIAGLVKGAASGEGLGNQFLSHIAEVHLIIHVLRCFEDGNIINTQNSVDPLGDYEIIMAELILKDLETIDRRLEKVSKTVKAAANDPKKKQEVADEISLLEKLKTALDKSDVETARRMLAATPVNAIPLLSTKRFLIVANMAEDEIDNYASNKYYEQLVATFGKESVIPVSAKVEGELAQLEPAEAQEMMDMLGLKTRGLDTIIAQTYHNLGLITFFTCGPKEIHAWTIKQGLTVRQAAGEIHSDLERGFICAEVYNYRDLKPGATLNSLKETGKIRTEGQDYLVQDGDILNIRFNV